MMVKKKVAKLSSVVIAVILKLDGFENGCGGKEGKGVKIHL